MFITPKRLYVVWQSTASLATLQPYSQNYSSKQQATIDAMKQTLTTNEEDQAAVKQLQSRIAKSNANVENTTSSSYAEEWLNIPSVSIADGAHKYVLISAVEPAPRPGVSDVDSVTNYFVVSKRGAAYHRNAAEPIVDQLGSHGYKDIRVTGGGRIFLDDGTKRISIFGFSYGFGKADHTKSMEVISADRRYKDYDVTVSDDGY